MILVLFTEKSVESDDFIQAAYRAYCRLNFVCSRNYFIDRSEGKPFFRDADGVKADVYFSLSHSGGITACAVSGENVGLDIQIHKDMDFKLLSKRIFHYEISEKTEFFDRYTQGEARAKLDNKGLMLGLYEGGGRNFNIFDGYSAAITGNVDSVFFQEYFGEE